MTLAPELTWLVLVTCLTGLLWMPYILQLMGQLGPIGAMWDPNGMNTHDAAWARRAKAAHRNAVENLVVFAPLALLVGLLEVGTTLTAGAAAVYFFVRIGQYLAHVFAIPVLRTCLFLIGVVCQAILALRLLNVL